MKISAFVLFTVLTSSSALAQPAASPQIVVTGEGVIKATPDQAWVSIGVESRAKVSKDAQQRNAQAMTAIHQKIAAFGIPKEAIRTTAVDLQLEFDYADGRQTPRGYVARNTIEVRVDDLAKLGDVLDAVVNSGATIVHGLRFDVKDRAELEAAALQRAVTGAMSKANAVAAGAKRAVDQILRVEEISSGEPGPVPRPFAMAARAESTTPVAPGELEIRAAVRLTVSIK